ncbi:MAG: class I SAM-dependent methyltransferase [Chloroflexota bacterium]
MLRRAASAKVELSKRFSRHGIDAFLEAELAGAPGPVLDLGCGLRPFDHLVSGGHSGRTIALDHRPRPDGDLVADAHHLPFADGSIGTVVCTEVFEHLLDPPTAASEIVRVLRPGGRLVLTTRFCFPLHERPSDFWRFTSYTLERLFAPLRPRVRPQHTAFQTLLVLLIRQVMEPTPLNRVLSLPVLAISAILWRADRLTSFLLPGDSLSSGYLVAGTKSSPGES